MYNLSLAEESFEFLSRLGTETIVFCPGARNSPWIEIGVRDSRFKPLFHFEERSAGFFALGLARKTQKPVAICVTSGTAVGELLPAIMEAHYAGLKLIILSADRPKRFRGTGAPQSCEQSHIFGPYTPSAYDIDRLSSPEFLEKRFRGFPLHLNYCFEEPLPKGTELRPEELGQENWQDLKINISWKSIIDHSKKPLLIVGALSPEEAKNLEPKLASLRIPMVLENLSHLRESETLAPYQLSPGKNFWNDLKKLEYTPDCVIRLGGIPTLRFWRDLELHPEVKDLPVICAHQLPFSGLPRAVHTTDISKLLDYLQSKNLPKVPWSAIQKYQEEKNKILNILLEKFPRSELSLVRAISEQIPPKSQVYLGNSLPIREWDLAATLKQKHFQYSANRGLNGIDGQISSFFGGLSEESPNMAILGDLTALYDLAAPWMLGQTPSQSWKIFIINNSGGKIFDRIFSSESYQNSHSLDFSAWAKMWNLSYLKTDTLNSLPTENIIEVCPCPRESQLFWKEWES